ncbi:unnamed protein product [Sphagnum balticum]
MIWLVDAEIETVEEKSICIGIFWLLTIALSFTTKQSFSYIDANASLPENVTSLTVDGSVLTIEFYDGASLDLISVSDLPSSQLIKISIATPTVDATNVTATFFQFGQSSRLLASSDAAAVEYILGRRLLAGVISSFITFVPFLVIGLLLRRIRRDALVNNREDRAELLNAEAEAWIESFLISLTISILGIQLNQMHRTARNHAADKARSSFESLFKNNTTPEEVEKNRSRDYHSWGPDGSRHEEAKIKSQY